VELTRPGGTIVYCTCSLEPEEGIEVIEDLLRRNSHVRRRPLAAGEIAGFGELVTAAGDLRTLPCHLPDSHIERSGLDGFYAARIERLVA
jgi:16S rRNA (cytosine967-C5)-methyltransferase